MSNAMSRSKSRWKGAALLAGASMAVIAPLAAHAQSMSVGIYANPLGGAGTNAYSGTSNVYIDPYDTDTLYVYATVTGTSAPSPTYVDGLNYVYFNVNAAATGTAGVTGSITAAAPSSLFGGGNFNQTNSNPGAGAQGGLISAITTTPSIVVGSNSSLGSIAKPRSPGNVFNTGTSMGSNEVVNGNSVSFLVETLTYQPSSSAIAAHQSTPTSVNSLSFNVSIPSVASIGGTQYTGANYFVGLGSNPGLTSPGTANTSTGYTSAANSIKLINALPGDANLDGSVDSTDLGILGSHFGGAVTTTTAPGGYAYNKGDFSNDGVVDSTDLGILGSNFGENLGSAPSVVTGIPASLLAAYDLPGGVASVPEPTSIALLWAGSAILLRRRRTR